MFVYLNKTYVIWLDLSKPRAHGTHNLAITLKSLSSQPMGSILNCNVGKGSSNAVN